VSGDITLLSAFVIGLLGSTHCLGMCGGIVGALTLGVRASSPAALMPYLLAYNLGRIASYALAGALAGALGAQLLQLVSPAQAQSIGRLISGVFLLAFGLYLTGWWRGLGVLERLGAKLWSRLEPLGRRLLPVRRPQQALALGLLWGWLPCGLVYAALAWSFASGDTGRGALQMLAFGLGTLPMLLAMGAAARWLGGLSRRPALRVGAGVLVLSAGIYTLLVPVAHVH
jgi:hypothetical protein